MVRKAVIQRNLMYQLPVTTLNTNTITLNIIIVFYLAYNYWLIELIMIIITIFHYHNGYYSLVISLLLWLLKTICFVLLTKFPVALPLQAYSFCAQLRRIVSLDIFIKSRCKYSNLYVRYNFVLLYSKYLVCNKFCFFFFL